MNIRSIFPFKKGLKDKTVIGSGSWDTSPQDATQGDLDLLVTEKLCGLGLPSYSLDIADYLAHYFPPKEMAGDERCQARED